MSSFLWYLLEANLILIVLFVAFRLTKKNMSFRVQRFFLLTLPIFAYGIVLMKSLLLEEVVVTMGVVELEPVLVGSAETISDSWWKMLTLSDIYWLGVIVALAFSLFRLLRVFFNMLTHATSKDDGFTIVEVDDQDSFSFFNYIQLRKDLENEGRELVLEHEKIHAKKLHSADVLVLEFYQAISWFNPCFLFIKKELSNLHEYEVDGLMYERHQEEYMKFLLAYSLGTSSSKHILTNQFSNSLTLKKRLKNMKTKKQKRWSSMVAIPAVAIGLSLISWTTISSVEAARESDQNGLHAKQIEKSPDVQPEFPGGQAVMFQFMQERIVYPKKAEEKNIQGTVFIQFVVDRNGALSDFSIAKSAHNLLDHEAMRVAKLMPNWIPGEKDGKKVSTSLTLPITFKL